MEFATTFHPDEKKDVAPKPEPILESMREAQAFIDKNKDLFQSISMDRSLRFKAGDAFVIDFKEGVITLDAKDFDLMRENGESEAQILWSVCHEMSHFRDLQQNPEGMLKHFEYMWSRARALAPKVEEIFIRRFGKIPPGFEEKIPFNEEIGETVTGTEKFVYDKLHLLYNSLDDMYVNDVLPLRTPSFAESGQDGKEVTRLYRDFLFPTDHDKLGQPPEEGRAVDYSSMPKSYQLAYALLRARMVKDQDVLVSDDMTQILDGFADETAKKYGFTLRKMVEQLTRYKNKEVRDPQVRYKKLKETAEPIYIKLLMADLETMPPPPPPKPKKEKGGKGKKGEPDGDEVDKTKQGTDPWQELDNKPEPIDLKTIQDFLKQKKEVDKGKEDKEKKERLTPEERAASDQASSDQRLAKKYDVDPAAAAAYRELQKSVEPYKEMLATVFGELMKTIEEKIRQFWVEGFRSGRLNVNRFIQKYGAEMATEQYHLIPFDELDVFDKKDLVSRISILPNQFHFRLIGDGSGSMNGDRIRALQQVVVLFEEAFATLEANMNHRFRMKEPVVCDTEIRMFGDVGKSKIVKPFLGSIRDMEQEMIARWKAIPEINSGYGMTHDAEVFYDILSTLKPEDEIKMKKGQLVEFVIEVTDGGSQTAQPTRNAAHTLSEKGMIVRALQIGVPSDEDKATFESIWGEDGERISDPSEIASAVSKMIAGEIRKISARIQHYEVEDESED